MRSVRNSDIKPCPDCNSRDIHVAEHYDDCGNIGYYCQCDDCGFQDPDLFDEENLAIDHWNRRVVNGYVNNDLTITDYDKTNETSNHNDLLEGRNDNGNSDYAINRLDDNIKPISWDV